QSAASESVQDAAQRDDDGHDRTERDHRRESLAAGRVQSDACPTMLKLRSQRETSARRRTLLGTFREVGFIALHLSGRQHTPGQLRRLSSWRNYSTSPQILPQYQQDQRILHADLAARSLYLGCVMAAITSSSLLASTCLFRLNSW